MSNHSSTPPTRSAFAAGFKGCLGVAAAIVFLFVIAPVTCVVIGGIAYDSKETRQREIHAEVCQPAVSAYAHYMIYHTAYLAVSDCRKLGQTTLTIPVEDFPQLALTITLQNTEPATVAAIQATIEQRLNKREKAWKRAWSKCLAADYTSTSRLSREYTPRLPKALRDGKAVTLDTAIITVRELDTATEAHNLAEEKAERESLIARKQDEKRESDMLRYYNNSNSLAVLGAATVCLNRCYEGKLTTYTYPTRDNRYTVTLWLPRIDGDIYNSAYGEIFGERHETLIRDNQEIISALNGRKLREFRHLEAQAEEIPFNGKISLQCGGKITIQRAGE